MIRELTSLRVVVVHVDQERQKAIIEIDGLRVEASVATTSPSVIARMAGLEGREAEAYMQLSHSHTLAEVLEYEILDVEEPVAGDALDMVLWMRSANLGWETADDIYQELGRRE